MKPSTLPASFLALILALCLVTTVFFDVLFLGRSLQPSNIVAAAEEPIQHSATAWWPSLKHDARTTDGFADVHGAAWQFEPAHHWMARALKTGESPWWNPHSASGTLGPETLVDLKFSPHVWVAARWFGASASSFDLGLLLIFIVGVWSVLYALRQVLQLGWLAAFAGAAVYLLNGFAVPNLMSQNGQPYFFAPLLLLSVLVFVRKQSWNNWVVLVLAHAVLLTVSILNVLLLVFITVHIVGIGYCLACAPAQPRPRLIVCAHYVGSVALGAVVVMLLVAPLWFPVVHSFFITDIASDFSGRSRWGWTRSIDGLLSWFTPRHFWVEQSHISRVTLYPEAHLEKTEGLIAYTGIVSSLVAACTPFRCHKFTPLFSVLAVLVLFPALRIFGLAPFVDDIPVLRSIGNQYWGCMSAIALPILVAFGVQQIRIGRIARLPVGLVLAVQMCALGWLYSRLGLPVDFHHRVYVLLIVLLMFAMLVGLVWMQGRTRYASAFVVCVVGMMLLELLSYMNTLRPARYNPLEKVPAVVAFLQSSLVEGRVLNIGQQGTLYPEYGAMFGVRQADTQNPGLLPWYEHFFERHFGNDSFLFLTLDGAPAHKRKKTSRKTLDLDETALDVASVRYVLVRKGAVAYQAFLTRRNYPVVYSDERVTVFENINFLPVAILVPLLVRASTLDAVVGFDPHAAALSADAGLLESAEEAGVSVLQQMSTTHVDAGTARLVAYHHDRVQLEVDARQASVLVLSDVWHPDWRATVDGQPVYVGLTNEAFRGIVVPAGRHQVEFCYDPPAKRYGFYAMWAVLALLILALLWRQWRANWRTRCPVMKQA